MKSNTAIKYRTKSFTASFLALMVFSMLLSACGSKTSDAPQASVSNRAIPAASSTSGEESAPNCANVTNDLTGIIKKNIPNDTKEIQFNWSNAVVTKTRADVNGLNCEATLDLVLGERTVQVTAAAYEILPLADGTGSRISIELEPIEQAAKSLINDRNESIAAKNNEQDKREYQIKVEKLKPLSGYYSGNEVKTIHIGYDSFPPHQLNVFIDIVACCSGTINATTTDNQTVTSDDNGCHLEIKAEDLGRTIRASLTPSTKHCPFREFSGVLLTKSPDE